MPHKEGYEDDTENNEAEGAADDDENEAVEVKDADETTNLKEEAIITPAQAWEDLGVYLLSAETVQEIATQFIDPEKKKTRLNICTSLWSALDSLQMGIPIRNRHKIPTHVVAARNWDAALTNAYIYAMMTDEEQAVERRRFTKSSESDKVRWSRWIHRLHKNANRHSIRLEKKDDTIIQQPIKEMRPRRQRSPEEVAALREAVEDPTKLDVFISHGTDPERVERLRRLVGYTSAQAVAERKKVEAKASKQKQQQHHERKKQDPKRKFGDVPKSIGAQVDAMSRRACESAIVQVAKYIQTIHYPNNGNDDMAMHSMVLVIYNEVEKQYNWTGGRMRQGKRAACYDLTVLAYDGHTCIKLIKALNDQLGACNRKNIYKVEGKSLTESAAEFFEEHTNYRASQRKNQCPNISFCVGCHTDLAAASYAQLNYPVAGCTHALCMVCFGQAHVNRSVSGDFRLGCLSDTCGHLAVAWNVVSFDGTKHLDPPVEQIIPHDPNDLPNEKKPKRPRRRLSNDDVEEDYGSNTWQLPVKELGLPKEKQIHRKFGIAPNTIGQQVDSFSRKAYEAAINKVAKFIQTIHYDNGEDTNLPVHSMALIAYNDVAKQTNFNGGRLLGKKQRNSFDLTVLAYDSETCEKITKALTDQYGAPESNNPRPPCTKHFIQKTDGLTLMESAQVHVDGLIQEEKKKRESLKKSENKRSEAETN